MRSKEKKLSNFSRAAASEASCYRPNNENDLIDCATKTHPAPILARGAGLSYSDSSLNTDGFIVDTVHLNHLIDFDSTSGTVICQSGISIHDLFLLHPEFIPPVIPGTVHATVGGPIAHDVHGKNNALAGSFGHHLLWFDLLINGQIIRCSREQNEALFYATIGGIGLTGVISRVALRLKKASRSVCVVHKKFRSLATLVDHMIVFGQNYEYQVAWLDLLGETPKAILSLANHSTTPISAKESTHSMPKLPFGVIKPWNMAWFNAVFFKSKHDQESTGLLQFNNPLDKITNWQYLYGPRGLIQFQAVFEAENALSTIEHLLTLMQKHKANPILSVLKLFSQSGDGLLSFCKPGFTLAIDFINNNESQAAIRAMNQYIAEIDGRIYLAKDLLLTKQQFQNMYKQHQQFTNTLLQNDCSMRSNLGIRLGIIQ